jgi:hypothetical protein
MHPPFAVDDFFSGIGYIQPFRQRFPLKNFASQFCGHRHSHFDPRQLYSVRTGRGGL